MSDYWYPLSVPTIGEEEIDAATEVLRSRNTTMGDKVEEFEEAFARRVRMPHAVMVNSGSSADLLIAMALDIDGEVIIPAVTWPTQVWSWDMARATVKFCDVSDVNTTAELIAQKITPNTKAISIPHLMGVPVEMNGILSLIEERGFLLHEDCCEALGSTYYGKPVGYYATAASWSFFFSHHMTTMEGGMVTTPHPDVASKIKSLRSHGWTRHKSKEKYVFDGPGFNLRPTEVSAAIGLVQLGKLEAMNNVRRNNYMEFVRRLGQHPGVSMMRPPPDTEPAMFGVPLLIHSGRRDDLAKFLERQGVETRPILAGNLKYQPGFKGFYFGKTPGADWIQTDGLYVGLHAAELYTAAADDVAKMIADFV